MTVLNKFPLIIFVLPLSLGCHSILLDSKSEDEVSLKSIVTKSGDIKDCTDEYLQFPTNNYYSNDSIFPLLTLENGLTVKYLGDSLYLFDGDLLINTSDLDKLAQLDTSVAQVPRSTTIITTTSLANYWTDGIVPFKMDISLPPAYRSAVQTAMNTISSVAPVTFKLMSSTNNYSDYLVFKYSSIESNSFVGRQGGPQTVNIKNNSLSTILHEIMHALGFFHEHSRSDRDQHIIINWPNIRPEKRYAFDKYNVSYSGVDLGSFDFSSIMLYSPIITDTSFVYDPHVSTMTDLSGGVWTANYTLSTGDIDGLWIVYGHPARQLTNSVSNYYLYSDATTYCESYLETTTLTFYNDFTYSTPMVLSHPARLNLLRSYTHIINNQIVTDDEVITVILPSGHSSYIIDSRPNVIYLVNGNPYHYDVTHYSLHN